MASGIVEFAEKLCKDKKTNWQKLYTSESGNAEETLIRCGHLVRFFPDFEGSDNTNHMEALATIGTVYA